jgi:hypothetical protein
MLAVLVGKDNGEPLLAVGHLPMATTKVKTDKVAGFFHF